MTPDDILLLAASHGLDLQAVTGFNEMGIDFRVAFATDRGGQEWVLRIPRRDGLDPQIQKEATILRLVRRHLSVSVPEWKIAAPDFVAYPLLEDQPVITFDPATHEILWNIDATDNDLPSSLARVLLELHTIPHAEVRQSGLKGPTIPEVRQELLDDVARVKREIGLGAALEARWRRWIDTDAFWPDFVTFVHGDLYAGHILADKSGNVTGIIDWSEAQLGDPSTDFSGQLAVFGEQRLRDLVTRYEEAGGRVWSKLLDHTRERHSAASLKYAAFALRTNSDTHLAAAKAQLDALG